jgi:hypothetical protein
MFAICFARSLEESLLSACVVDSGKRWKYILLIDYVKHGILHEDFSGFAWNVDVFPGICRRERKLVRSPPNHFPCNNFSSCPAGGLGIWEQTIFLMQSCHSFDRGSGDNCSCVEDL